MDLLTRHQVAEMLAFREQIKSTMSEPDWNMVLEANKVEVTKVMVVCDCDAISAVEKILDRLEADTTMNEWLREARKGIFVIVAMEMMGPGFIDSLTE